MLLGKHEVGETIWGIVDTGSGDGQSRASAGTVRALRSLCGALGLRQSPQPLRCMHPASFQICSPVPGVLGDAG